ncbi:MAG: cobalamin-dependent protein, partial [Deltaproteobacteria bacterium]|nr:cobalamin-dependent protein [Deltaproteobacteria bacterium]
MKVLLIQPPMFHLGVVIAPNLGLAYIAAVLEKAGIEVRVFDAAAERVFFDEIIDQIRDFKPHLIGAGGQTPVSPRSLVIFQRAKREVDPGIITLAGGPHFTFTDQESLEQCSELDIVVRGEGEATILELCQKIEAGESLAGVKGITYRNSDGKIIRNPDREPIADLDSIPFPAWHLFPVEKYHWVGNKVLAISSSRGCPYRCPYCITWKIHKGVRQRNPVKIVEEMVWVKRNFNHDTFFFQDDASFLVRDQLEDFLNALEKSGEQLYWYYETREDVFLSYRDLWQRMKKNGLFKIVFGLETPDPNLRECCGKKGFNCKVVEE